VKRPSFLHGVIVAAVLGFFASAIVATLTPFIGLASVVRLVIPAMTLAYLLYLFSRSDERLGRVTALTFWAILAVVTWWLAPPLPLYLLVHAGAIWLIRSLYFYSGVVPALLDLGTSALSITATVWAISSSGSVFLATWCFFLVQALFVAVPPAIRKRNERAVTSSNETFEHAKRNADRALHQLFTQ